MKKILYLLPLLIMIVACGAQPALTPDVSNMVNATLTAIAQNNPQPLATQVTPPAQPIATTAAGNCTYGAMLVSENPQDGRQFKPSEAFKKTWTFKNSGTCLWDASTLMLTVANAPGDTVLSGGQSPAYRMDIYSNPKKTTVAVGETISMTLDMQAPDHGGTFTQNWQIINSTNNQNIMLTYVTGTTGKNFYVQIVVPGASNGGASGGQNPSVKIQQIEMQQGARACTTNAIYMVSAKITGAANAEVSYTVSGGNNGSAGPDAGIITIRLDNTGGYNVHTGLSGPFSDPGNVQITITVFVNGQAVNYVNAVICQGGQYTTAASDGGASGEQKPSVKIQQIEMQQGTQACTASAGYIISAKITGATNAQVSYTISSGNNGAIFAPDAAGATIMLDNTGGYDVNFGIQGPFSDPGNVKITVFVNGQSGNYANAVICQGGEYKQ